MKKLLLTLALLMTFTSFAETKLPTEIVFEEGNHFAITGAFNGKLLDDFSEKVLNYEGDEIYLYFDSPGGSVLALSRMARIMKSSKIKFTCVANFAASAGFMLFQHCDNRIMLSDGIIMSHNWAGGFQDEGPRILTLFNAVQSLVDTLEAVAIEKMNVDKKEYAALINNNLWMPVGLATKYGAIDGVLDNVRCSKDLIEKRVQIGYIREGFYGPASPLYKSGCPMVQKVYKKVTNERGVEYIGLEGNSLFDQAQNNYVLENANWFYSGKK